MKGSTISRRVWNRDQSWNYEHVLAYLGHKLRISIRRNAYDAQSFAKVDHFHEGEWRIIVHKAIEFCHCCSIRYVQAEIDENLFDQDANELMSEAMRILR